MSAGKTQVLLIFSATVLFVLLFFAPKKLHKQAESAGAGSKEEVKTDANLQVYYDMATRALDPLKKREVDRLITINRFDSVAIAWDRLKRPDLASFFAEKSAQKTGDATSWIKAGNRYYYSVQFCNDKTEVPVLYQSAMRCFKRGLALEPRNTDARIMLASCFVEGTSDPMAGITMLKEVERNDSGNVKLNLTFAFFSVKSGQYQKAVERFKKVLAIDSTYIEAYLHLADAYEQLNEPARTIEVLEKYSAKTDDVTAKIEINKYIQQLKNNNLN